MVSLEFIYKYLGIDPIPKDCKKLFSLVDRVSVIFEILMLQYQSKFIPKKGIMNYAKCK